MRADWILQHIIRPGLAMLPPLYRTEDAERMLLAIGYQESGWEHRIQLNGGKRVWWMADGPARGYSQFEHNGVKAVLNHPAASRIVRPVLKHLHYPAHTSVIHPALAYADHLAVVFARALLWTVPEALPAPAERDEGWRQYEWAWRPGDPHADRWPEAWEFARGAV